MYVEVCVCVCVCVYACVRACVCAFYKMGTHESLHQQMNVKVVSELICAPCLYLPTRMMFNGYRTAMYLSTLIPISRLLEAIRRTYLLQQ